MDTSHEYKMTLTEDVFYPAHPNPRSESATFSRTKSVGKAAGLRCCISGQADDVEYHHIFCEWAWADAVDWHQVKAVATGEVKELCVLDVTTDMPTDLKYPVEQSLLWMMLQITKARGFDWSEFDPEKPETFVDSAANMLVLHKKFHRGPYHGAHELTAPIWGFQMFPRKSGFIFSPDEVKEESK